LGTEEREKQRLEAAQMELQNWIKKRINVLGKKREHRT
jgi:hypothetical protein